MPRYQNEIGSTLLFQRGRKRVFPKGSIDPATQKRTDFVDLSDEDMKDLGIQSFIKSKKLVPFDGLEAGKPTPAPVKVAEKTFPVPDLTAGLDGQPMRPTETVKTTSEPAAAKMVDLGTPLAEAVAQKVEVVHVSVDMSQAQQGVISEQNQNMSKKARRRMEAEAAAAAANTEPKTEG
jgi:hypothetical protein